MCLFFNGNIIFDLRRFGLRPRFQQHKLGLKMTLAYVNFVSVAYGSTQGIIYF
jgi:hypothetical protein